MHTLVPKQRPHVLRRQRAQVLEEFLISPVLAARRTAVEEQSLETGDSRGKARST